MTEIAKIDQKTIRLYFQEGQVQEALHYFVYKLIGRWWQAHRSLLSEAGFKLPQAAGIKSAGGER